ncbi:MAG: hypothetical protein QM813_08905 [Verrucomicrobiota bacterium]
MHSTTNILLIPRLAAKCSEPFVPADPATKQAARARCCTSDLTLAEFKRLCGKIDGVNAEATRVEDYVRASTAAAADAPSCGSVLSHDEYIELVDELGRSFTPELKAPVVAMPFHGYTQETYARAMLAAYEAHGIDATRVYAQSLSLDDIRQWYPEKPDFGKQAVFLDERVDQKGGLAVGEREPRPRSRKKACASWRRRCGRS